MDVGDDGRKTAARKTRSDGRTDGRTDRPPARAARFGAAAAAP